MRDFYGQNRSGRGQEIFEGYDVAQICLNGHEANSSMQKMPQFNKSFCDKCGEPTINQCASCNTPIRGYYWGSMSTRYHAPRHCYQCGKAFPWTERKIQAAIELFLDESPMKGEEAEEFKRNVNDIVSDSPRTSLAANRFKRAVKSVTAPIGNAIRDILVDIASESAKKIIWPDKP